MSWSYTLEKSLDTVSADYLNSLMAYAKENPQIERGMTVGVFQGDAERTFIGFGRVLDDPLWCGFSEGYVANVQMYWLEASLFDYPCVLMERAAWSPSVTRSLLTLHKHFSARKS